MMRTDEAEREGLVAAIRDEPDDDMPRLIYADWLDDHGEHDQAEFVRDALRDPASQLVALTREGRDPLALLGQPPITLAGGRLWTWSATSDLGLAVVDPARRMIYHVDRGMIDAVRCDQPDPFASWEEYGPWLARRHPLRRVLFAGVARGNGNHYIVFRGAGHGDVPARLWDATGMAAYACRRRSSCPDGAAPGPRGTHACFTSLAHAEDVLSSVMIAWARQEIGG